jgi:hypothetical protein
VLVDAGLLRKRPMVILDRPGVITGAVNGVHHRDSTTLWKRATSSGRIAAQAPPRSFS